MALIEIKKAAVAAGAAGIIIFAGLHMRVQAADKGQGQGQDNDQKLAQIGLSIMPDFVKMQGKDPTLLGLGSFIVNAQADCNGCHGSDPVNEFLPTNNPFLRPPLNGSMKFNQATYLNGGQNFGSVGPGIVLDVNNPVYAGPGNGPLIITRHRTPDHTGNPEGGNDLAKFMTILRTGHDFDALHPNCGGPVTDVCYNFPINGDVLLIMPWDKFQNMTDYQLTAIWTYLSTVPCNAHNDALGMKFPWLQNVCN